MPDFELVSLDEARLQTSLTGARGAIMKEYLGYIDRIQGGRAGKLRVGEGETTAAIRRRLGAAAQQAGKELVISRIGDEVYFWVEVGSAAPRRRGRRPKNA
jgi:hypothetical protein